MRQSNSPPIYAQVAFDIAAKIASGELKEGDQFSGRSLMSSRYGVSPETIRRAIGHLSDLGVVAIKNNSGSTVISQGQTRKVSFIRPEETTTTSSCFSAEIPAEGRKQNTSFFLHPSDRAGII